MDASQIAEQAIDKMENEAGKPTPEDDNKPTPPEDGGAGNPKSGEGAEADKPVAPEVKYDKDGKRIEPDKTEQENEEETEEGTFTADDAVEEEVVTDTPKTTPTDSNGVVLSADERKFISEHIDEIGQPVQFTGKLNGKEVTFKVYDVADLPGNFEPDNVVQFQQGVQTLGNMAKKAEKMLGEYRQQQSQQSAQDFEKRENEAIRQDVADLQKAGDFPKFKVQPGQPGFDEDPAAQMMVEVLQVMNERNEQYLKEWNQGRAYRHIGFREAHEIWAAQQARGAAAKRQQDDQKREDEERHNNADKIGTNKGLTSSGLQKPRVRSGTTVEQILNAHDGEF